MRLSHNHSSAPATAHPVRKRFLLSALMLLAVVLGSGCFKDDQARRGSEVENEIRVGRVVLPDGTPAPGASVRIYTVDHVPGILLPKAGAKNPLDI